MQPMTTTNQNKKMETDTADKQNTPSSRLHEPNCSASWLLIETAPNSLNVILVTDGESVWTDQKIGKYGDTLPGDYYFNGHENWEEVTHWIPIPSLPNATSHATADNNQPTQQ
jgi:hypothetical protein